MGDASYVVKRTTRGETQAPVERLSMCLGREYDLLGASLFRFVQQELHDLVPHAVTAPFRERGDPGNESWATGER